jgi:molybdate transport system regulatory protein
MPAPRFLPRIRIIADGEIALGPGKASLLEAIAESGSIAGAARLLDMSYKRAWSLVRTMNACFRTPLVTSARGGEDRGGALLTPRGRSVLALYRRMEAQARRATARDRAALRRHLR